ncbi:DUF3592 domain-containing protein [Nocardia sp. NPDC058058]|uniref:DUF3592 domain-containing protein n=1 Tax=Nocardia sp. NPDC058058 TaxID=3346317 RepID=UPI0036DBEA47
MSQPISPSSARRIPTVLAVAFFAAWIGLGPVVAWQMSEPELGIFRNLDEQGVRTAATLIESQPRNHNTVVYMFSVNGKWYLSRDSSRGTNPPAKELTSGSTIQIVYDRRDPNSSCSCDPGAELKLRSATALRAAIGVDVIGVIAAMYCWFGRRQIKFVPPPSDHRSPPR